MQNHYEFTVATKRWTISHSQDGVQQQKNVHLDEQWLTTVYAMQLSSYIQGVHTSFVHYTVHSVFTWTKIQVFLNTMPHNQRIPRKLFLGITTHKEGYIMGYLLYESGNI